MPAHILYEGLMLPTQHLVERFLGEGAFAQVYRVRHRVFGRQAMKVFKQPVQPQQDITGMLSEGILLSKIGHPNIVRVFDAGAFDLGGEQYGYLTMEYAGGGTLYDLWNSHGNKTLSVATSLDLVGQTAAGLSVAHHANPPVIHRDIKPNNILVAITAEGYQAKVSDFGLAKQVNPLTLMATAAGTLPFKAPEVFITEKADSPAGDVWSLGVTLYLLLTDQMPYAVPEGATPSRRIYETPPTLPSRLNFECDAGLDAIVLRALAFEPADRYAHAGEFREAVCAWKPQSETASITGFAQGGSRSSLKTQVQAVPTPEHEQAGHWMKQAYAQARSGQLGAAADLLEEALKADPSLRSSHESRVRLWRMGVAM
jgi:serine/threonine protein kinase